MSYRRDDAPGDARSIRDSLARKFGNSSVFMDVDNLLAGQRFDEALAKAIAQCDVIITVMGPRWLDLLRARSQLSERDYVREEIAAALQRKIAIMPVRVGREGNMAPMPRADDLPEDIQSLVLHQKLDVSHERFGRDMSDLIEAIIALRRRDRPPLPWRKYATRAIVLAAVVGAGLVAYRLIEQGLKEAKESADREARFARVAEVKRQTAIANSTTEAERQAKDRENRARLAELQKQWAQEKAVTGTKDVLQAEKRNAKPTKKYIDGNLEMLEGVIFAENGKVRDPNSGEGVDFDLKLCKTTCSQDSSCLAFSWLPPSGFYTDGVCNNFYTVNGVELITYKKAIIGTKRE